jgi:serine phosphatase RsbU (regulator of sigma subunit)/ligand-binding sensor domain-containing protein
MQKLTVLVLAVILALQGFAQLNRTGIPFFRNYSPKEYKAHNQNWSVVRDLRGFIYFGNNDNGILEYDGNTWREIPIPNNAIVRTLAVDSNGVVYVGAVGEIGYLEPDVSGNLHYKSLMHMLDTSRYKFSNIWKVYVNEKNEVYYCALNYIFRYNHDGKVSAVPLNQNSFFSFLMDENIYVGNYDSGLLIMTDDFVKQAPGGEFFAQKDILKMMYFRKNQYLLYTYDGLFIYDAVSGAVKGYAENAQSEKTQTFLLDNAAYAGTRISDEVFAWATLNKGVLIAEKKGKMLENYNVATGLGDEMISDVLYTSDQGLLWMTSNNGISKVEYNSPVRFFGKESGLLGTVFSIIRFDGDLLAGTNLGLYILKFGEDGMPVFEPVPQIVNEAVYAFAKMRTSDGKQRLIIGTSSDLYEWTDGAAKAFKAADIYAYCLYPSPSNPDILYIGIEKGLRVAEWKNGKWIIRNKEGVKTETRSICEDKDGNLWLGTLINGVLRIGKDGKISRYSMADGLPVMNDIFISNTYKGLVFSTTKGFYKFNDQTSKFEPWEPFGHKFTEHKSNIIGLFPGFNNQFWVNINNRVYKLIRHYEEFNIDSTAFLRLPQMSVQMIYAEPDGLTWIGGSEGLFCYDNFFKREYNIPYHTYIRQVVLTSNDSILFNGTFFRKKVVGKDTMLVPNVSQPDEMKPVLDYKNNYLTFIFAAPYFEDEASIQYSYLLEGMSENWTKWSNENKAVYTNLKEGHYIFRVKAMNIYGIESIEGTYEFEISPPWYRTIWAYIGYGIFGIFLFYVSLKLYTRKLEADKKRLEGIVEERTAEVVRQKDEILEKNIEIEHINKDITDSIRYAKRIQHALLPSEDIIKVPSIEIFIYFRPKDIVSGDFYFLRAVERANIIIAAAADCTGHGVPGAFMSMLGMSFLNEIVTKSEVQHSDEVLNYLRDNIIKSLNQSGKEGETKDGMDISLVAIDYDKKTLEFSGANNPLYIIRDNELTEYKGDKMPIGLHDRMDVPFNREVLQMQTGDVVYLFSDGFPDQFGGDKGKKYMYKKMKEYFVSIHQLPLSEQRELIDQEGINWRNGMEQIDDQIIMGIKFL